MKKEEKNRKILATILAICGVLVWFFVESEKEIIIDILKGLGIFMFIMGLASFNKFESQEKKKQMSFIVVGALFVLALIVAMFVLFKK